MLKKEYTQFEKNIKQLRAIVAQMNGFVEGISPVKKNKKVSKTKANNIISAPNVNEKD